MQLPKNFKEFSLKPLCGAILALTMATGSGAWAEEMSIAQAREALPQSVQSEGISIGFAEYPPDQYIDIDGELTGWAVELLQQVGVELDVPVSFTKVSNFQALLPGVDAKKYDFAVGSYTITDERKNRYDMVSYFEGGNSLVIRTGQPEVEPGALCGLKAALSLGSYHGAVLDGISKQCLEAGSPEIEVLTYPTSEAVLVALDSRRADFSIGTLSASMYLVSKTNGRYSVSGPPFFRTVTGFAFSKSEPSISNAIVVALNKMIENGEYTRIMKKWNLEDGAVKAAKLNP